MSRYSEYRANGPTVLERHPTLRAAYDQLVEDHDCHFDLVTAICGMNGKDRTTPLFMSDILLLSVLNRSLDLVDGFLWSFDRWNISTAAPIVRMQVDNVLRLGFLAKAGPGPAEEILLSGRRLDHERDPLAPTDKKYKLNDVRLREHARDQFPWLDLVYEKSSGWVHFSSVHVGVTMEVAAVGFRATSTDSHSSFWSKFSGQCTSPRLDCLMSSRCLPTASVLPLWAGTIVLRSRFGVRAARRV
jgi:hypothetical protein